MMDALVVFESMYGNTRQVAEAVADGLSEFVTAAAVEVGSAPSPGAGLLVAGGPTHAFSMSTANSRRDAHRQAGGPLVSEGIGLREWIAGLDDGSDGTLVATFDTRVDRPRLPGSAARSAERRLRRLGYRTLAPATSFYVSGSQGPLVDGELERAHAWGARLGAALVAGRGATRTR